MTLPRAWFALLLLAFLPVAALAGDEAPALEKPKGAEIGQKVDFSGTDPDGKEVRLSDLRITKEKAWEAVKAAAAEFGAPAAATPETKVADLPGLKDEEGSVDETLLSQLAGNAGRRFGVVWDPDADTAPKVETLGDLAAWIESAATSPIVVLVWSPNCSACKNGGDEKLVKLLTETGARLVVLDSDFRDTAKEVKDYLDGHGWSWLVLMDNEQKITDVVGGTRTPQAFLLDADLTLRYRGAVVRPPDPEKNETEERPHLREAIEAVKKGEKVSVDTTEPVG